MTRYAADRYVSHFDAMGGSWSLCVTERGNNGPRLSVECSDGGGGSVEMDSDEAAAFAEALAHARQFLDRPSGGL